MLLENKSPQRKCGQLDNRGSHFYLALYWAKALAEQRSSASLAEQFATLSETLASKEEVIISELNSVQGQEVNIGGYYSPDPEKLVEAMRPSAAFNALIDGLQ